MVYKVNHRALATAVDLVLIAANDVTDSGGLRLHQVQFDQRAKDAVESALLHAIALARGTGWQHPIPSNCKYMVMSKSVQAD